MTSSELNQYLEFQSTLPLRGATWDAKNRHGLPDISIHAPLTGSDERVLCALRVRSFQSTLPLRGATGCPNSLV